MVVQIGNIARHWRIPTYKEVLEVDYNAVRCSRLLQPLCSWSACLILHVSIYSIAACDALPHIMHASQTDTQRMLFTYGQVFASLSIGLPVCLSIMRRLQRPQYYLRYYSGALTHPTPWLLFFFNFMCHWLFCFALLPLTKRRGNSFSVCCMSVCLSVCMYVCLYVRNTITFESLELESSF